MTPPRPALTDPLTRNAVFVERLKAGEIKKFDPYLAEIDAQIREILTRDDVAGLSRQRLEALLATIAEMMQGAQERFTTQLQLDLQTFAVYQSEFAGRALNDAAPAAVVNVPTADIVATALLTQPLHVRGPEAGKLLEPFIADWSEAERIAVAGTIRLGVVQGQTTAQIIKSIRGSRALNYADGLLDVTRRHAAAVVQTAIAHAGDVGRQATYAANSDIVAEEQWVSTLDSHTTQLCFVGSTIVRSVGILENIFRAEYCGEIVTVTTASGKKLEGTPNHPILTTDGFLPLGKLNPSEHVVYSMLFDGVEVGSDKNVGVPTTLAELFNAFDEPAVADIFSKRPTAIDFYGDGVGMNGKIDVLRLNRQLGSNVKTARGKGIKNVAFRAVHSAASFARSCRLHLLGCGRMPLAQSAQRQPVFAKDSPHPLVRASLDRASDLCGPHASIEKLNRTRRIGREVQVTLAALEGWHHANALEQGSDGRGGNSVHAAELACGGAGLVREDQIVSVERELRSCHVFTLGNSLGFYIAGGVIVKNCRSLDGLQFPVNEGIRPPAHINCRSIRVPVMEAEFAYLSAGATRASTKGQVDAKLTYYEWLKDQPASFQDKAIGPVRAKLFRDGGLSVETFAELNLGRNFEPLTLDEMRALEPLAFERAGIP